MGYTLTISSIKNDHAKTVIARIIAHKQSTSLQKAFLMANHPPFVLLSDVTLEEIQSVSSQLKTLNIIYEISEIKSIKLEKTISIPPQNFKKVDLQPQLPLKEKSYDRGIPIPTPIPIQIETPLHKKRFSTIIITGLIGIFFILLLFANYKKSSGFLSHYFGTLPFKVDSTKNKPEHKIHNFTNDKHLDNHPIDKKLSSTQYTDSAEANSNNYEMMIKFYKIAISFNQNNFKAWQGLVNAYNENGDVNDENKTRREMKRIFGDSIFTIEKIIEPYGILLHVQLNQDSSYEFEYKTNSSKEKDLVLESYQIIKAIKPNCDCNSISLFAAHTAGTGMIAHIKTDRSILTMPEYERAVTLTFLK